jgi:hypothetical protein
MKSTGHAHFRACLVSFAVLAGCGQARPSTSSEQYYVLDPAYFGVIKHVKEDSIAICVDGMTKTEQWSEWTVTSVKHWLDTIRSLSTTPVATDVRLVGSDEGACRTADAEVDLSPQNFRAYTNIGARPVIHVSRQDARSGHVILHELGHAFGLDDTYNKPDTNRQPDSVMKTATFDAPQADDIAGMKDLYGQAYPDGFVDVPVASLLRPENQATPRRDPEGEVLNDCLRYGG